MKLRKKLFAIIAYLSMMMGAVSLSSTFGWFDNKVTTGEDVYGESAGAYFAYGNGSKEKPYGISNKRHLYNLAWLQYLGKFNDRDFYFELADDIDMGGLVLPPIGTTKYPFIGHFSGLAKDSTETTKKCHQISNLVIANTAGQMSSVPEAVRNTNEFKNQNELSNLESIGLFGCIGDIKDYDGDHIGTIHDTDTFVLHDFKVSNIRLESKTDSTLAGVIAGYVDGKIDNVSVNVSKNVSSSSITIEKGGSALSLGSKTFPSTSEFTSVGYCESEYQTIQYRSENQVYSPITNEGFTFTAGGTENEWGGSLDMSAFTERLNDLSSNYAVTLQPNQYSLEEKTTLDSVGKEYRTDRSYFTSYQSGSYRFDASQYYENNVKNGMIYDPLIGSLNMVKYSSVYYLNSGTKVNEEAFKVNVTSGSVQSIGLNGHYLAVSNDNQLISIDTNTFAWCIPSMVNGSGTGKIYSHINKRELYLTIDSNNELNLTETSNDAISWSIGMKDNTYKITYGNYYIDYNSAADSFFLNLKQVKSTSFKIMAKNTDAISTSVGTGGTKTELKERAYYLALNNTADGDKYYFDYQVFDEKGETKNEAKALEWYIGDQVTLTHGNGSYTCYSLYCVIDGIDYYLECTASASENKEFYLTKSPSSNQKSNYFYFNETKGYLVSLFGTDTFRKLRHIQSGASDADWGWCYASNDSSPDTDSSSNDFAICYTGSSADYLVYSFSSEYNKIKTEKDAIEDGKYMFSFAAVDFNVSEIHFDYNRDDVTYLPINVDSNYEASQSNTGYLIGGTQEDKTDDFSPYGNVRVSDYGSKKNSLKDYENIKNESQTPLTITYDESQYNIAE